MKILYFDPILGTSGDMILASLIDLGVPQNYLREKLKFVPGFELRVTRVIRNGVSAKRLDFKTKKKVVEKQFIPLIEKSKLSKSIKNQAIKIIERIFKIEKKVHHAKDVHLHELADADTLLDIAGALIAIEYLDIEQVYTKSLKAGKGFIKTKEGNMPAFNFATAELLKGYPVEFMPVHAELTTPTGAAILSTIAQPNEHLVLSNLMGVGMGAGTMKIQDYPNLMRVFLGETTSDLVDECTVLETNIDDMNPQHYDVVFEKLYAAGALEVFLTGTIMKNSRPGIQLTVLTKGHVEPILDILFKETTTLGIRTRSTKRIVLPRKILKIISPYGPIRVKLTQHCKNTRFSLEYQDIKKLAKKHKSTILDMHNKLTRFVEKQNLKLKI
jgi:uncharacterized protein (TIGR00299 family) protein